MCGLFFGGFWWVVPVLGMVTCLGVLLIASRFAGTGHGFMCMGGHRGRPAAKDAETSQPKVPR